MPQKEVFVSGGSNGILARGWFYQFRDQLGAEYLVRNLSVGASNSLMGAYRTMFCGKATPGSTLIWEYALNNAQMVDFEGLSPHLLLRWVEYTILYCMQNDIRFIGLILTPQNREVKIAEHPETTSLKQLFDHHGVEYIDISELFRETYETAHIPIEDYHGNNHFINEGRVNAFIASTVASLVRREAPRTENYPALIVSELGDLVALDPTSGGTFSEYSNNLLTVPSWNPAAGGLVFETVDFPIKLAGVVILMANSGGEIKVTGADRDFSFTLDRVVKPVHGKLLQMYDVGQFLTELILPARAELRLSWSSPELAGNGRICSVLAEKA